MNLFLRSTSYFLWTVIIIQFSCKKEYAVNKPPIAVAGPDQSITLPSDSVSLDGSSSKDPDGKISVWHWTKISGPSTPPIVRPYDSKLTVKFIATGAYQFELKVTDNNGLSANDTIRIIVAPAVNLPDPCSAGRSTINVQLVPVGKLSGPKENIAIAAAGNKIVFAGGWDGSESVSTVDIYDIVTSAWSTTQLSTARNNLAVTTCSNKIFFGGGAYNTDYSGPYLKKNVDIYDASTNTWSVDSLSAARNGLTATSVGNKVIFAGGNSPNYSYYFSNIVDIYDLTTKTWSTASLSEGRAYLSAVTVDNKIYFAGGENGFLTISNRVDIYDNATSSWSVTSMSEPKTRMANIAFGNKIYWAGGANSFSQSLKPSGMVEVYDVFAKTSSMACLSHPDMWNPQGVAEVNGKLVFFAGYGFSGAINRIDVYDVATNTWSIGLLNQNLYNCSIISVNNTIYVAGGSTSQTTGTLSDQVWKLLFYTK